MSRGAGGWRVVVAALSIFVLGAAAGIAADRTLHRPPRMVAFQQMSPEERIETLGPSLDLTPEQRTRILAIMHARQPAVDAVWRDARTRLEATVDSVVAEIGAVLEPHQQARYRALVDAFRAAEITQGLSKQFH